MLKFFGFDLELFVDVAYEGRDAVLYSAKGVQGEGWLIVRVDDDPEHLVWVCAPISARALHEVSSGQATVRDALCHSSTGTVEVVTVEHGRAVPDRCLCCSDIPDYLLPGLERRVALAA